MARMAMSVSVLAMAAAMALGGRAFGQSTPSSDPAVQDALKAMQSEIEKLRTENQKMRGEIDDLHAKSEDNWLTEARAEQIRGLVQDVLADADTRASLRDDGLQAGWSDHFFLSSADGRFSLILEGLMQIRWVWNHHDFPDKYRWGFENTRTYITFHGNVFSPDVQYLIRGDFSRNGGTDTLLDAWIRWNMTDEWSGRIGEFKLPFLREELVYEGYLQTVERSLVNQTNTAGRSQGVELTWGADYDRVSGAYSDGGSTTALVGAGGSHTNLPWSAEDTEWAFTARYEHLFAGNWGQFAQITSPPGDEFGLMVGLAGTAQQLESTGNTNPFFPAPQTEATWLGYTADVSVDFGGANIFAYWVQNYIDAPSFHYNVYNFVLQGGLYVTPKWEAFARFEYSWVEISEGQGSIEPLAVITAGVNYYIQGQDLKWSTDMGVGLYRVQSPLYPSDIAGWRDDPSGADPQFVIRTQFQLLF